MTDYKRYSYVNTEMGSAIRGDTQDVQEAILRDAHMRGYER